MAEKMLVPLEIGVTSKPPSRRMSNLRFFIGGNNDGIGRIDSPACLVVLIFGEMFAGGGESPSLSLSIRSMTSVGVGRLGLVVVFSVGLFDPAAFAPKLDAIPVIATAPAALPSKLDAIGVIVVRL